MKAAIFLIKKKFSAQARVNVIISIAVRNIHSIFYYSC